LQELSFGSGLHDKMGGFIDDIEIATNIAKSANGNGNENSIAAYGYKWSWQDGRESIVMVNIKHHVNHSWRLRKGYQGISQNASCNCIYVFIYPNVQ